jgi:titin
VTKIILPHAFIPPGTPGPPSRIGYKKVRRDSVEIEWEPPKMDGGSEVTSYIIEKRENRDKARWSFVHKVPASTTEYEIPGLTTGKEYTFRVKPVSKIGVGESIQPTAPVLVSSEYSELSFFRTHSFYLIVFQFLEPPAAPRGPVMITNVTNESADIHWQPPEFTGGLPLTNYFVDMRETTRTGWRRVGTLDPTTRSWTLKNLREGKEYVVRVTAKNREGESLPLLSDFIAVHETKGKKTIAISYFCVQSVFCYSDPPAAPNMLKIMHMERDSVSLEWYAPFSDGGSDITEYVILKKQMPREVWEEVGRVKPSKTTYTVTGLREAKPHFFAVYAVNKAGRGDQIETAKAIMPRRKYCKSISFP